MAISNFAPTYWSALLTHKLRKTSVFAGAATRAWEPVLGSNGKIVKIFTLSNTTTIKDYDRTADIDAPQTLTTTEQELNLDQEKYFNFGVEDLDRFQSAGDLMPEALTDTVENLSQTVDGFAVGLLNGVANNTFGLYKEQGTFDLADLLSEVKEEALKKNIPLNRLQWVTTPNVIRKIDKAYGDGTFGEAGYTRFIGQSSSTNDASQSNGLVGRINGIELWASNEDSMKVAPSGSGQSAVAGHSVHYIFDRRDWAMVVQVNKTEAYRPERRFMDAVKGLTNYGGKVLNSSRMQKWTTND